jgi:hypothetical protein
MYRRKPRVARLWGKTQLESDTTTLPPDIGALTAIQTGPIEEHCTNDLTNTQR